MAAGAAKWIWENSRASNGSLIVLLAIADETGEGEFAEMKIAEIARKSRLSDRAARMAVKELERLGELSVTPARGTASRYALCTTPAKSAGPTPANIAGGAKSAGPPTPAKSAGVVDHVRPKRRRSDGIVSPPLANIAGPEIPDVFDLGSVVSGERSKPKSMSETPRPDVDRLCKHLADRIEGNGFTRPKIGQRWRTAARLMLDADKRSEDDVHKAIDWCTRHHFWWKNVRSMEKLRQHYERLQADAKDEMRKKARPAANGHQPTREEFAALRDNWARPLDAQEAGIDPRGNDRANGVHSNRLPSAEDQPGNGDRLV